MQFLLHKIYYHLKTNIIYAQLLNLILKHINYCYLNILFKLCIHDYTLKHLGTDNHL